MKTFEQWQQDHFPTNAWSLQNATDEECVNHSIAKFSGLKKENLPEGWKYEDRELLDHEGDVFLRANSSSCALCCKYASSECTNRAGEACPIARLFSKTCCDEGSMPYKAYVASADDPAPMLDLLSLVLDALRLEASIND